MNNSLFDIDKRLLELADEAEAECKDIFGDFSDTADYNGQKV